MSLLKARERQCVILIENRVPDRAGGETVTWTEGEEFANRPALDTSMEARKAEKLGVSSVYSGMIDADVPLRYGDIFRDTVSGATFRVTSRPEENQAPLCASPMLRGKMYFTAERVELPT